MSALPIDFMKIWTQNDPDSERRLGRAILDAFDSVVQDHSDLLSKLPLGDTPVAPVFRWMEEWGYPSQIKARLSEDQLSLAGCLFGEAINAENARTVIREGTILERASDGIQVKVASEHGLSATVNAYGNTSLSEDAEPVIWDIISEAWSDFRDASDPRSLDRRFREVGTHIHAETFDIPKTRRHTKYEIVANEVEHQIGALLTKLRRQLGYAVLRSRPFHDGTGYVYGDKTEEPTMCGLCAWPSITQAEQPNPNVFVNKDSGAVSKEDLDGLIRNLWLDEHADYNQGDWWIVCHPITHQFIQDFEICHRRLDATDSSVGFRVDEFRSKIGKSFPILSERIIRPDMLIVVNFDKFSYGYFQNDRCERKEVPTQGRYQRWLISFQTYGVVARNPRASIGMIYGLPTT